MTAVWIVEAVPPEGAAKFLCAGAQWTTQAWDALHFARKRDADEVADYLSPHVYPGKDWTLRVESHSFDMALVDDEPPIPVATEIDGAVVHSDKPMSPESREVARELIRSVRKQLSQEA